MRTCALIARFSKRMGKGLKFEDAFLSCAATSGSQAKSAPKPLFTLFGTLFRGSPSPMKNPLKTSWRAAEGHFGRWEGSQGSGRWQPAGRGSDPPGYAQVRTRSRPNAHLRINCAPEPSARGLRHGDRGCGNTMGQGCGKACGRVRGGAGGGRAGSQPSACVGCGSRRTANAEPERRGSKAPTAPPASPLPARRRARLLLRRQHRPPPLPWADAAWAWAANEGGGALCTTSAVRGPAAQPGRSHRPTSAPQVLPQGFLTRQKKWKDTEIMRRCAFPHPRFRPIQSGLRGRRTPEGRRDAWAGTPGLPLTTGG